MVRDWIQIRDLSVSYDLKPALWDVDLDIPLGQLVAIVGPNGAGKSTLIKSLVNLIKPITGTIRFGGKTYREMQKQIAYVPQRGSVDWDFPTTVFDVVLMGTYGHLGWIRRPGKQAKRKAEEALVKLGIDHLKDRQISELSGGQQQRVFLARALVQEADLYIMDEPFQGVDLKTEQAIVKLLRELKDQGKSVIIVHHDLDKIESYFDWVVLLNRRVVANGWVKDVFTPDNIALAYRNQPFKVRDLNV
ncbi:MAG TPA: metal ABC transporter ATP-binding protein [Haloplasmataceae bacterium]